MFSAYITMPSVIETPEILRCKLGLLKTVTCLQVVALNRKETDKLLEVSGAVFDEYIYPEDGEQHFFERKRTHEFL